MSASLESATEGFLPGAEKLPDFRGETSWRLEKEKIPEQMAALKAKGFTYLVDLTAVDHHGEDPRFEVVYELCDIQRKKHLRIKTKVSEGTRFQQFRIFGKQPSGMRERRGTWWGCALPDIQIFGEF